MNQSPIFADIDYDRTGKQIGHFHVPHSPHSDAWGVVPIPIAVIANGKGPTALLMGGVHGDEYEGPIVLTRLIRRQEPDQVSGRLIVLPSLNAPAVAAGCRVSPLDGKNLNRCFPGDPAGTVSEQIACYVTSTLFPMADLIIDLHSGGSSLDMIPSAFIETADDAEHLQRNTDAVLAFDAPLSIVHDVSSQPGTSNAAAVSMGKTFIGTELGGSGSVSIEGLEVAERGIYNALAQQGIVDQRLKREPAERRTRLLRTEGDKACVYAPAAGVFQPFHKLGARVEAGTAAGAVHFLDDPSRRPKKVDFNTSGILFSRRCPGKVVHGSCVAVVGAEQQIF